MTDMNEVEILLVEDNLIDQELTLRALKENNLAKRVHVVKDGAEALEFIFATGAYIHRKIDNGPRIILLDLKLPKVDGLEVLRRIKSDHRTKMTPVVVLTSSDEERDIVESYRLGVDSYLVKPVDFDQFVHAVSQLGLYWMLDREIKILMLEDLPSDQKLVERELREAKLRAYIKRVETKEEFTAKLQSFSPDIILSDYTLPSFDGMSALKIVRESFPDLPFLFLTGSLGEEAAIETLKRGATDYVLKERMSRLAPSVRRAIVEAEERKQRKHAEKRILEQAALLDIATDAIIIQDIAQNVLFWNKSAERLYGWKAEEAKFKSVSDLLYKKEDLQKILDSTEILKERGEWKGELPQMTKDGGEIIVESRWTLVRDGEGTPNSIFIVNTDVTEKKKLEAQLLRAQRLESIGTLAGGIAHDLNNVLSPIMMALQLLRRKLSDEQSQDWINTLESSVERGADLIKQVLSFARGMGGERSLIQVRYVIPEVEKIAKETFPRSIDIRTEIAKELWNISGDITQIHQVLMNMCVNARDAMPDGGLLSMSAENVLIDENYAQMNIDAQVGPYIAVSVSDTGMGIPPEVMDRIFEPFFTTKGPEKGTGLGLSTAYGIVKGHGGFIHVYSEVGKGTRFKIYLPAVENVETEKTGEMQHEGLPLGHTELILVVDDELSVCEIARVTLETFGYRVVTANDGAEGVALYAQNKGDIGAVILDMMMPIMDGAASIRALKKIDPNVKIIAVSGLRDYVRFGEFTASDVGAFLSKPYTAEELLKTLDRVLRPK